MNCDYSCYPPGTTSDKICPKPGAYVSGADCGYDLPLVYVARPQNYYGAQAECARLGGALARVGSIAEAYGSGWTGDSGRIWIADSGAGRDECQEPSTDEGRCPCINCALPSETKPFICDLGRAASW